MLPIPLMPLGSRSINSSLRPKGRWWKRGRGREGRREAGGWRRRRRRRVLMKKEREEDKD